MSAELIRVVVDEAVKGRTCISRGRGSRLTRFCCTGVVLEMGFASASIRSSWVHACIADRLRVLAPEWDLPGGVLEAAPGIGKWPQLH
jgi:hypothetical protein